MKKFLLTLWCLPFFVPGEVHAGDASLTGFTGSAGFSSKERTYLGTYATANKSMSVEIDGVNYKGSYTSVAEELNGTYSGAQSGSWGRAFLFASSANILRCQLDAAFPKVSGTCQDAGGRNFQLIPVTAKQTFAVP